MARGIGQYILVRALMIIPTVLILYTVVFLILRVLPGDPITAILGTKNIPPEQLEALRKSLGLDKSYVEQYLSYLYNAVFHLDFGTSMTIRGRPIWDDIKERFPRTLELTLYGFTLSVILGVATGLIAAKRGGKTDVSMRLYSIIAYTLFIPWFGLMLQLVFGVWLGWLPTSGILDANVKIHHITGMNTLDALLTGNWTGFKSALRHIILPSLTLGIVLSGAYTRLVRANVAEVLKMDYIRAYRVRGVPEYRITYYALKNAFVPIVTMMGLQFAILLGGAVLTETTFSWPGMGTYLVNAIESRDYPAIQGTVIFFAFLVGLVSLIVDVVYALIDPRIKY